MLALHACAPLSHVALFPLAQVFENAEDTAAKYQERIAAERKAREEAAQDVIFGLESVFTDGDSKEAPAAAAEEPAAAEE